MHFQNIVNLLVENPQRDSRVHGWSNVDVIKGNAQRHLPNWRSEIFTCKENKLSSTSGEELPKPCTKHAEHDDIWAVRNINDLHTLQVRLEPVLTKPGVSVVLEARPEVDEGESL